MSKQFLGVIIAVILIFVGVFALTSHKASGPSSKKSGSSATLTEHVQGKGSAGVTLVEYGDYQCPFCQQYYSVVKQVQTEFNDQIKLQFRNFPLTSLHPNAFAAARAAEAAAIQGKFWEMHDMLYEDANWQVWTTASDPTPYFEQYASELKLNSAQFKTDFASSTVNDLINNDEDEGTRLGVSGTPTFFLDGKKIEVASNLSAFEKFIKPEIAKKSPTTN